MFTQKRICHLKSSWIGLATIVIIIVAIMLSQRSTNHIVRSTNNSYKAYFSTVEGLSTRTPIYLSGCKVGHVELVGLDHDLKSYAWLSIDKKITLPDDSSFAVKEDGFMGTKVIVINFGVSDTYFKNNDTVVYTNVGMSMVKIVDLLIDYVGKLKKGSK